MAEADSLMLSVSGCRGVVGTTLTPEVVVRFAGAIARWLIESSGDPRPGVVLARDGRRGGDVIHLLSAGALAASGCRVIDLGVATTPTVGVMVRHHAARGGVVVTASHNPAQWNGMKAIDARGAAPAPAEAARLVAMYHESRPLLARHDRLGAIDHDGASAHVHVAAVLRAIEPICSVDAIKSRRWPVVLDSVNASGRAGGRLLLEALGCTLTHINAEESGDFPHSPEPLRENLTALGEAVRAARAAVGFAQDPDADRLALLDERGDYVGEEYTLALSAQSLLSSLPETEARGAVLAANLSTSRMIDDVAARYGAAVRRTPVGEANVYAAMHEAGAVLGGEGNGGVIWPTVVPIRDSLGAMALVLALMTKRGGRLSSLGRELPSYAIEKRKVDAAPGAVARAISVLRGLAASRAGAINDRDGVRADFDVPGGRAWVHVRASNTEPAIRFIAEAPTAAQARALLDEVQRGSAAAR